MENQQQVSMELLWQRVSAILDRVIQSQTEAILRAAELFAHCI